MATQDPAEHYTVLARRFRPQTFDEVVGQEHVGRAICNAICNDRVAHAYLFTGARGVGKTSTARIFAKALNCPHVADGVPCNECDVCQSISSGTDVDVLEIDGASNRGIDDIRSLRANVNVRSMRSRFKVYIIDEVHMLTREAFNALLKTLEEPPPSVKFVFCTTEPNKVPDTILSRCQRFDFGMIGLSTVTQRLQAIAEAEGVEIDPEAVELVARRGGGSMRDAQSLFDQLLAFGEERIGCDDVHRLLGTAPDERLVELVQSLVDCDQAAALTRTEEALASGVQLGSLTDQMLDYLRDLLISAVDADAVPLSSVSERLRSKLNSQASAWGIETISAAMQILVDTKGRMSRVNYARALLDLGLVRICLLERLDSLAELVRGVHENVSPHETTPGKATARTQRAVGTPQQRPSPDGKKNESEVSAPVAVETPTAPGSESLETIGFDPANSDAFISQLLMNLPDMTASHLKNASRSAIFGPNRLEFSFTRRYSFCKNYCERPEAIRRIQSVANVLAGQPVELVIECDDSTPEEEESAATAPKLPVARRLSNRTTEGDPFVQQVLSVFGGSVVDVRAAPSDTAD